jgi:predicted DNA-binding transcriptional regulator AlpA
VSAVVEPSEYLTIADVMAHFHASRMWVARRTLDANFPKPIKFGPGISAVRFWRRADLLALEHSREAMAS